jgi:hypothetical protein
VSSFYVCIQYFPQPRANHVSQIDVREPSDVMAALVFSQTTGVALSVKNTGHDYKGGRLTALRMG